MKSFASAKSNYVLKMENGNVSYCKLSTFTPDCPDLWFVIAERSMAESGVTNPANKLTCCLRSIDNCVLKDIRDIVLGQTPAGQDEYEYFKERIVQRFTDSKNVRITKLLQDQEMGDRTPSQYLRHLKHQCGNSITEDALRVVWVKGLPKQMRVIMATQEDVPLEKAAALADTILETQRMPEYSGSSAIAAVNVERQPNDMLAEMLVKTMTMLGEIMQTDRRYPRQRSRSRSSSRPRGMSPSQQSRNEGLCWYHLKFGAQAHKCIQPCAYNRNQSQPGNASGSH